MKLLAGGLAVAVLVAFSCTLFAGEGRERPADVQLKAGDAAPDFTLKSPDGKESVTLSSFKGRQPVVLVFGSFT